jgi:hypothetical protein
MEREKYSAALNFSAIFANWGAIKIKQRPLKSPPATDEITAVLNAFPASPRWAMGNPSRTVADADGCPGALRRMAEIEPPYIAPQNMAARVTRAAPYSRLYTRGKRRIIPIDPVIPGIAPRIIPPTTPISIISMVWGSNACIKP